MMSAVLGSLILQINEEDPSEVKNTTDGSNPTLFILLAKPLF